jgi:hypothetical protein
MAHYVCMCGASGVRWLHDGVIREHAGETPVYFERGDDGGHRIEPAPTLDDYDRRGSH